MRRRIALSALLLAALACTGEEAACPECTDGGVAGAAGTTGSGDCGSFPPEYCVSWCGGDVVFMPKCVAGHWKCEVGQKFTSECPDDTCFTVPRICCSPGGQATGATCPGQGAPVCPPGTTMLPFGPVGCPKPPGCEASGCAANEVCLFPDDACGKSAPGACAARPATCSGTGPKVCGCDGAVYDDQCLAHKAGVDLGSSCTPPAGTHPCGTAFCKLGAEYCRITVTSSTGALTSECPALPSGCSGDGDCACLADEPCANDCSEGLTMPKLSCSQN